MERDLIMKHRYKLVSTLLATTLVAPVLTNVTHADTITGIKKAEELVKAIENAKDGDTVKLAPPTHIDQDGYVGVISESIAGLQNKEPKEFVFNKNITIDLNGNELIFRGISVVNTGNLLIKNGTVGVMGEGKSTGMLFNEGRLSITGLASTADGRVLTPSKFVNEGTLFIDKNSNQTIEGGVDERDGSKFYREETIQPATETTTPGATTPVVPTPVAPAPGTSTSVVPTPATPTLDTSTPVIPTPVPNITSPDIAPVTPTPGTPAPNTPVLNITSSAATSQATIAPGTTKLENRNQIDGERISGRSRIDTAINVSKKSYPNGAKSVIIANKDQMSDVLTAVPFSVQIGAPILFTNSNELPIGVIDEIRRLGANEVYINGGTLSVAESVEEKLRKDGKKVTRFSGRNRYETARVIGEKIREKGNKNIVEIASGESFPDALSISSLAKKHNAPILLTRKNSLTEATRNAMSKWGVQNATIAGQTGTISSQVEDEIKKTVRYTTRLGGANRYETSVIIAKAAVQNPTLGVYTSGEIFADALVAGAYAGVNDAPVILINENGVPRSVETFTRESKIKKFVVVGGTTTVQESVLNKIKEILKTK